MAKGDDQRVRNAITDARNQTNAQQNQLWNQYSTQLPGLQSQGQAERENILSGYGRIAETGGISPEDAARMRSLYQNPLTGQNVGGGGGGGSYVESGYSGNFHPQGSLFDAPYAGYSEFARTGGVDIGKLEEALGGFREMSGASGGFDAARLGRINESIAGLQGIGGQYGGFDPQALGQIRSDITQIRNTAGTGGYNPNVLGDLRGTINQLRNYGQTGGLTPFEIDRIRDKGYEEFATTGGYTPEQISDIRSRALAPIQALGRQQQQQLEQARRINPTGANYAASMAAGSRGNAQALGDASLNAEVSLADAIRQGRQFGITGRAGQELALGQLLSGNRIGATGAAAGYGNQLEGDVARNRFNMLQAAAQGTGDLEQRIINNRIAGLTGAGNMELGVQGQISSDRLGALRGITDTNYGAQSLVQGGRLAGLGGMMTVEQAREAARLQAEQMAAAQASAAAARAQAAGQFDQAQSLRERQFGAEIEEFLIGQGQQGQLAGLGGLAGMYGQVYGPEAQAMQYQYNLPNAQAANNMGYINQQIAGSQIPGAWQQGFNNVMRGAEAVAGLGGAFMGTPTPPIRSNPLPGGGATTLPQSPPPIQWNIPNSSNRGNYW